MDKDFSKITSFWKKRLQQLPATYLDGRGLDVETVYYLTHVGLPCDLKDLNQAIEVNFYFLSNQIVNREFRGINYCILGDDGGTHLAVSLLDKHLYAINLGNEVGIDPVCFVNSTIDKFVETLQLFIEYQKKLSNGHGTEAELIALMKIEMRNIDEKSITHPDTWWSSIIDDPIH